ncbi:hypothetical protein [Henriciella pelagia]|uniref:DUF4129 domain-containing protein n=1 Tax=Henriciella pelagia TaxID=1977912 RepID=A0ABQ1J0N4_9PROT|nr:hypothetical protein [Henriciella pelagia]GGB57049.1 hypothetical protein GCM10011503_01780 [Henriciella pelagia]
MAEADKKWNPFRDETMLTGFAGLSALWAGIILITLIKDAREPGHLPDDVWWPVLIAAFGVLWLGAQLLRHVAVWKTYCEAYETVSADRDKPQKKRADSGFREFFLYPALSLSGLGLVAYLAAANGRIGAIDVAISGDQLKPVHMATFLAFFIAAFLPLIVIITRHARLEAEARRREGQGPEILRDDVVSNASFVTTLVLIGLIVALAWGAAGEKFSMKEDFGVFITFLVLVVFFVIILAPHVMRFRNDYRERQEEKIIARGRVLSAGISIASPGRWISYADSILVRFVAPLSGATQNGPFVPHLLVVMVILPLSALGYVLAAPWGLIPIGIAMLIALSLGRRWAWVEEDRETASRLRSTRGRKIAIGFQNDLKDEALLGYASLFVLVPLALSQLQGWTGTFGYKEEFSSNNAFIDWLRFFGAELAKAVPFVDWWEIYSVDIEAPYSAEGGNGQLAMHLTFAARAMVDLVIMAALFQAIGLWQRSRIQHSLYKGGQVDSFEPFEEANFFERGMIKDPQTKKRRAKRQFEERIDRHVEARKALGMAETPYSPRRLSELIHSTNPDVKAGALWMIEKYDVLAGSPAEQLSRLSRRFNAPRFAVAATSSEPDDEYYVRAQKGELERVLLELEQRPDLFRDKQVDELVQILIVVKDLPEFTSAEKTSITLFERELSRKSLLALCNFIMEDDHRASKAGELLQAAIKEEFGEHSNLFMGLAPMRVDVYSAIETHGLISRSGEPRDRIVDLLRWMGQESDEMFGVKGDRAQPARERALAAANLIASGLMKLPP